MFYSISLSSNPSRFNESSSYFNKIGNKYIKDDDLIVLLNKNSNKEDLFKELEDNDIPYSFIDSYEGIIHGINIKINKTCEN